MTRFLPPLSLTGAHILRNGAMQYGAISLAEGRITGAALPDVDLSGYLILPGIIDLHGDGFEHHMAPRPSAPMPFAAGFASLDRQAVSQGVTTAYLAQGWSWEGGHRGPDHAEQLIQALADYRPRALTDLRIQLRAETHLVAETERLVETVRRYGIDYVVFNDHLDEGIQMLSGTPAAFAVWARTVGTSPEQMTEAIQLARSMHRDVPQSLCRLACAFDQMGVRYGSHDDPDGETRERFRMIGAQIAEFPLTHAAASAAHAMSCPVLMGAPNVVRGQSQSGNVAAADLIAAGLCDALVSDYHLPTLPLAAWALADRGVISFAGAWALISTGPAAIMGMTDRGRLDAGLRADLVIIAAQSRQIEVVISGGRLGYLAGEAAQRFLAQPRLQSDALPLAAE